MSEFSSYYLYQRYEKRGNQDWIPCIPTIYSISGDSQNPMPLSMKNECDSQCGCQESIIERWVNIDPSIDWICDGTSKYYKQQKEISYDYGTTWIPLDTYRQGALIETSSSDCTSPMPTIYRWYASGYTCIGYDKWVQSIRQVSYDNGNTWSNVEPTEYSATTLVEANSEYCGYVPPAFDGKWLATYSDFHTESAACDSSSAITRYEINTSSLVSVEIGNCVTSIGYNVFEHGYNLTSCTIGSSVTSIESNAFSYCSSLPNIFIPSGVTYIDADAFWHCHSLTSCTFEEGSQLTSIGSEAFAYCSGLTSIEIPSGVTNINSLVFFCCDSLSSVTIPDSVTSIGYESFGFCYSLTSITIPSSVTSIGNSVFYGSSGLTSVICLATIPPTFGTNVFYHTSNNLVIYVPSGSVNAYKTASGWSTYSSRIQAIP